MMYFLLFSDESTRQQEHEAAYGLLSLSSQKPSQNLIKSQDGFSPFLHVVDSSTLPDKFMNTEQVTQLNNSSFARNKILDKQVTLNFKSHPTDDELDTNSNNETEKVSQFFGKSSTSRPLTYPYTLPLIGLSCNSIETETSVPYESENEEKRKLREDLEETTIVTNTGTSSYRNYDDHQVKEDLVTKVSDRVVINNLSYNCVTADTKKRKPEPSNAEYVTKVYRMQSDSEAMDLSMPDKPARIAEESDAEYYGYVQCNGLNEHTSGIAKESSPPRPAVILNDIQIRSGSSVNTSSPSPEEKTDEGIHKS